MKNLTENLFELNQDEIDSSKVTYDGKIIRCLVAPYHSYGKLEQVVPYTPQTFLFPERDMTNQQERSFISMVVKNPNLTDVKIITTSMNIISDVISSSVRILTEYDTIENPHAKTFAANIHDIRYELLENEKYQKSKSEKQNSVNIIKEYIDEINNGISSLDQYNTLKTKVQHIDEPILRTKLLEMLSMNSNF